MRTEDGLYVHRDGGVCMQKCIDCGWKGNQTGGYMVCPDCGSLDLLDDHNANP